MVALAADLGLALEDVERRPGGDGRVDVGEVPLVGRDLPVRVLVARAQQQLDLLLGEVDVDQRERRAVERQVPGGEPGVLPLVGHRDHVARDHVEPLGVAHVRVGGARAPRVHAVLAQPAVHVVLVVLLAPQQAGERLAHDERLVGREHRRDDGRVELVGLRAARGEHRVEVDLAARLARQPHADLRAGAGRDLEHVVGRALRAGAGRVHGVGRAVDHVVVDRVLGVHGGVGRTEQPLVVGLVLAEQEVGVGGQAPLAEVGMGGEHALAVHLQGGLGAVVAPRPGVAEPERRQQVQGRGVRPAVVRRDEHQDVVGRRLRVFDLDVEVAVIVEDPGVEQLVLEVGLAAMAVGLHEIVVRVRLSAGTCRRTSGRSASASSRRRTSTP